MTDAKKTLASLAMLGMMGDAAMTNTTPTTTAPATVLSEDDVTATQAALTSALMDARMGRYLPFVDELAISHRALAAQVRVLRPVVEWYAVEDNHRREWVEDAFGTGRQEIEAIVKDKGDRARRALAVLEEEA